jgi:hypothetical protein
MHIEIINQILETVILVVFRDDSPWTEYNLADDEFDDLFALSPHEVDKECYNFLGGSFMYWLDHSIENIDSRYLSVSSESLAKGLIEYCVYIKSSILNGETIEYADFIDTILSTLGLENTNYNLIFNHPGFTNYIPCFLEQMENYSYLTKGIPNQTLGEVYGRAPGLLIYKIENQAQFAELVLNNLPTILNGYSPQELNQFVTEAVNKLNYISNQPISVEDVYHNSKLPLAQTDPQPQPEAQSEQSTTTTTTTTIILRTILTTFALGIVTYCVSGTLVLSL